MSDKLAKGVSAAVLTPRDREGRLDEDSLGSNITYLIAKGIHGIVLNGATGEYCLTTPDELRRMLAVARCAVAGKAALICGIGAAGLRATLELGALAAREGVDAVLLPAPHFFPYGQDDLDAFFRAAASRLPLPVLLYNIPLVTSALNAETVRTLIDECPNIVGIKDSSGSLAILEDLTEHSPSASRLLGNDEVLAAALSRRLCDGVVSGIAGVLPEPIFQLYEHRADPASVSFRKAAANLADVIRQIVPFPVPWALKWIAEFRGFGAATFAQPVSPARLRQRDKLQAWFASCEWCGPVAAPISGSRDR